MLLYCIGVFLCGVLGFAFHSVQFSPQKVWGLENDWDKVREETKFGWGGGTLIEICALNFCN